MNEQSIYELEKEYRKVHPLYILILLIITSCDENMKMITIHENDIQFIQEKVNQINQSMISNIHAFQKIIQERQDLLCQIFSIQDEKLACCLAYDNLVNTYSYTQSNQIEKDLELREISRKLTSLSNQLEEAVSTLEQVNRTVNDHVNSMIEMHRMIL